MEAKALFLEGFYSQRARYADTPTEQIRGAGKPTKANPRGEDELWWLENGPPMVQRWIDWRKRSDWKIWHTPDGVPGIELALEADFDGTPFKVIIDRVFITPAGTIVIVDLKSGARKPESDLQLAFCAATIQLVYGVDAHHGAYWDARSGELTPVANLQHLSPPLLKYWVGQFAQARDKGIFLPNISNRCKACGVRSYCAAVGGNKADKDPDFKIAYQISDGEETAHGYTD